MTTYDEEPLATVTVNDLQIDVWYAGDRRDEDGGIRRAYGYRIADNDRAHTPVERTDLASGVGADIDVHEALSTLVTFMGAAGDGYRQVISNPDADPESMRMFPLWVCEAAYMNSDELAILTIDFDDVSTNRPAPTLDHHPHHAGEQVQPAVTNPTRPGYDARRLTRARSSRLFAFGYRICARSRRLDLELHLTVSESGQLR